MEELLKLKYYDNTIKEYLTAVLILILTFLIIHFIKKILLKRIKIKIESSGFNKYNYIEKSVNRLLIPAIYLGAIYLVLEYLSFGKQADRIISIVSLIILTYFIIRFTIALIKFLLDRYFQKQRGVEELQRIQPLYGIINLIVWIIGLIFLLDNLGFHVTTIVTGLGITGIAVALAAQALLGDLFSYFVIFFDKPFEVGDFISFDGKMGNIEKIGIKTTKIKSINGEQLIVANSKLTSAIVHNFKRLEKRRVVLKLGVTYQTPFEKLKSIPEMIKEIIIKNDLVQFDRGHFAGYGDFSLNFEFVYFILSPDYLTYMDIQQKINYDIFEKFEKEKIEFAYPTQTIFINKSE
ncbi:mechanosensitive ion channel family protein [Rosettibacter firmus]|uniref:mechanosensitive ion channel family protein n=1 Tax=Rosettibacter firmus TaxID=3111522 RepID=UPI00336C2189